MRTCRIAVLLFSLCGVAASVASADPITVTAGSATVGSGLSGSGPISLTGTDGFSLAGFLGSDGRVDAKLCFPCPAGTKISVSSLFSGLDLPITKVTLDGITYPGTTINRLDSPGGVFITFFGGTVVAPPITADRVVLTSPFALTGSFSLAPDFQTQPKGGSFAGTGLASLTLFRDGPNELWDFGGVRYQVGAVTPEPASLLLFGTGLIAIAGALRRRREQRKE